MRDERLTKGAALAVAWRFVFVFACVVLALNPDALMFVRVAWVIVGIHEAFVAYRIMRRRDLEQQMLENIDSMLRIWEERRADIERLKAIRAEVVESVDRLLEEAKEQLPK